MLSVGKLAHGQEHYYLDAVASGVEDYYLDSGETPGQWTGAGAALLGLGTGQVDTGDLQSVLGGVDPSTGAQLTRAGTARRPRVPGFDLTFSAPKSVSVLYGLSAEQVAAQVVAAHETAVAAGVDYLERHATFTRRRIEGVVEMFKGEGLCVAAFRHRTSRAGDPQLHTHCLAANLVRAVDGRWGTLDSKSVYRHARTAGFVYQAVLRGELTDRLGVGWGEVRNGHAEIEGVPLPVLRAFSQRRVEIESRLAERGQHSAAAAQAATLDTRHAKDYNVDPVTLRHQWADRAAALGFRAADLDTAPRRGATRSRSFDETAVALELVGPTGLTARTAAFERRDVVRAWCERLPAGAVSVGDLDRLTDDILTSPHVVHLTGNPTVPDVIRRGDGILVPAEVDRRRFSTLDMLVVEGRVIDGAAARAHDRVGIVAPAVIAAIVAGRPELTGEQAAMVQRLTTSGAGVEVVIGKAGSGKTYALAAANAAWTAAGYQTTGVALAARAAHELHEAAGIPATTVAQLLLDLDRPDVSFGPRTVAVVDEASMVDTRQLDQLLTHAQQAGAKVVLVGDHRQLPEIDAGGAFAGLANRVDTTELHQNRRQHHPWERHALDELRAGDVSAAMTAYQAQERVVSGDDADSVRDAMVADWYQARQAGERVVMIAVRNRDVEDLNRRARARLLLDGTVTGDDLTVGEHAFGVGDEVLCLRNNRRLGVLNSTVGTVVRVDAHGRSLVVMLADGTPAVLPAGYLNSGHLTHAYATTVHKAQGLTVDRTYLLGNDHLYREAGYVGLSRGRTTNHLYVVSHDRDEALELHPTTRHDTDPCQEVVNALHRSGAKQLATDEADAAPVLSGDLAALWAEHDKLCRGLALNAPDRVRQVRADGVVTATAAATPHAGVVVDNAYPAAASSASRGTGPRRSEAGARPIEPHEARLAHQAVKVTGLVHGGDEHEAWEAERRDAAHRVAALRAGLDRAQRAAGRAAELDPSPDVVAVLGAPPHDPEGREAWRAGAGAIESYRARWGTGNPLDLLNPTSPLTANQEHHRADVAHAIVNVRQQLSMELPGASASPVPSAGGFEL